MPVWAYLLAAYLGVSLLKIRTFLEHQAHERARGRTVIIEDRGPLALLFLNNNLHVVHHAHPRVPWYRLPALYRANRARFLGMNEGYRFGSYGEIFTRYLLRAKDPVPHPLLRRETASAVVAAEAVHAAGPLEAHDRALEAR
jgi:fatty acid desaturase